MKSTPLARLDQATPRWPELLATLGDEESTVIIGGVPRALVSDDVQVELVAVAAEQAVRHHRPIRLTVNGADSSITRLIVTPESVVHTLDIGTPTTQQNATSGLPEAAAPAASHDVKHDDTQPARARKARKRNTRRGGTATPAKVLKWVSIGVAASLVALVAIVVVKSMQAEDAPPPAAQQNTLELPAPPAARIYTETPPPGWSKQAWWALPIAADTQPVTDPGTGVTVIVSATDNATQAPVINPDGDPTQHEPKFLSVVDQHGRGLWSAPLNDERPRIGPIITTVDGARVVMTGDGSTLTYWPLTGGQATVVELPEEAAAQVNVAGESPLITLDDDRLGYLADGAMQTVQVLPRTEPVFALDGSVILQQPDTGSWWNVIADTAPTSITPKAAAAGMTLDSIVGITPQAAFIAWTAKTSDGRPAERVTAVAYNLADGKELARTEADRSDIRTGGKGALYDTTTGMSTAAGLVLTAGQPAQLIVVPGLRATAVQDAVYGSSSDADAIVIGPGAGPVELRDGTVTPSGHTTAHLMVVSQNNLYALKPAAKAATTSKPTPTRVTVTKTVPGPVKTVSGPTKTVPGPTKTVQKPVTRVVPTTVTAPPSASAAESSGG